MPGQIPIGVDFTDTSHNVVTSVQGGTDILARITLDGAAGSGGQVVTLTEPSGLLDTAAGSAHVGGGRDVTVPQGATTLDVAYSTNPVLANTSVTLTASANGGNASGSITLTS